MNFGSENLRRQVGLPIYVANMLKSIKANSLQTAAQLELMGHPNAFPSVPVASASDWTIMQSLHYQTLRLTVKINGGSAHWKAATTDILQGVESTRQLLRNLREKDRRISPTVHASVLLMPTQKFLREVIDLPGVDEASGPDHTRLAQFKRMFMDNGMLECEGLEEALQVYESFHVLEALPSRWSAQHLFKCNCRTCFQYASCPHVLLASMVCDAKIEVPLQYLTTTFQNRRGRGRPSKSGQQADVEKADDEPDKRAKVHAEEGYEVPQVTMRMENLDSDEDFVQEQPVQVSFAVLLF